MRAERRWSNHAALFLVSAIVSATVLRVTPVFLAAVMSDSSFGLLNKTSIPYAIRFGAGILVLDLSLYAMHRLFHSVPWLWRIHAVHHSDPDFDVSTAVRFHPVEVLISRGGYLAVVGLLAPPPLAVLVAELLAAAENLLVHANCSLPKGAEKLLRSFIITPDLHRIHHSEEMREQNLNFGQLLPVWDRLLGTYSSSPAKGENGLTTGLKETRNSDALALRFMLAGPFQSQPTVPQEPHTEPRP